MIPMVFALDEVACSRKLAKSGAFGGVRTPPTVLPPVESIAARATPSILWPPARFTVTKNQLFAPSAASAATVVFVSEDESKVQCAVFGEHSLVVRSSCWAPV